MYEAINQYHIVWSSVYRKQCRGSAGSSHLLRRIHVGKELNAQSETVESTAIISSIRNFFSWLMCCS